MLDRLISFAQRPAQVVPMRPAQVHAAMITLCLLPEKVDVLEWAPLETLGAVDPMDGFPCFYGNREAAYEFAWAELQSGINASVVRKNNLWYVV